MKTGELNELAVAISDDQVRAEIESFCGFGGGKIETGLWWNTRAVASRDRKYVKRALRYIELRGDALPYRVMRKGSLMRFADKRSVKKQPA
jgi:hypothetical protein